MLDLVHHQIFFKKLNEEAVIPSRQTPGSAGLDLVSVENHFIPSGEIRSIGLGFATSFPAEIHFRIESRSGLALKGLVVLTGVIDSDYRGEWKVILQNLSRQPLRVERGQRIAQAVARPVLVTTFEEVESLLETSRGAGGFGSTGN